MKVMTRPAVFDVWELFVHDSNLRNHPCDEYLLEEAINSRLEQLAPPSLAFVRVCCPAECGLSRWALRWRKYYDPSTPEWRSFEKRIYSAAEARKSCPPEVAAALDAINQETVFLAARPNAAEEKA